MELTAISRAREYSKNIREMGNGFNKMEPGAGDIYIKTANVIDDLIKEYEIKRNVRFNTKSIHGIL